MCANESGEENQYPNMVGARVSDETDERVRRYAEEHHDGSVSVAARELLKQGLDSNRLRPNATPLTVGLSLVLGAVLLLVAQWPLSAAVGVLAGLWGTALLAGTVAGYLS
jgi:predicted phage tail protein